VIYSLGSEIVGSMAAMQAGKSIDLGCCQLDVVQSPRPTNGKQAAARKK
jgi:hypothetical protein